MTQVFAGQKIIVVGGTSGMGKAVARLVLQQGGTAVIVGSRKAKAGGAVQELSRDGKVVGLAANLADSNERNALIDRINTEHRDATLLVNAAGVFLPKPFVDYEESDYDLYLDINKGTFFIIGLWTNSKMIRDWHLRIFSQ